MKTLLSMLGTITLGATTIPNFSNSNFNINKNITANYKQNIQSQTLDVQDLSDVLVDRDLENIYVGNSNKPTSDQIKLELIKNRNFNLDISHISISNITKTDAKVTGDGIKYTGEEIIIFKEKDAIEFVSTDKDGNVYIGTHYSFVYKSNGTNTFTKMTWTAAKYSNIGYLTSLATDKNSNIYAGIVGNNLEGLIYKCKAGETNFTKMQAMHTIIWVLATDKDGNVYAGSKNGIVYKSNGKDTFTEMSGTNGIIKSLVTDKDNNVYAGSKNGFLYKSEKNINPWPMGNFEINYHYHNSNWVYWSESLNFNDQKTFSIIKYDTYAWNWDDFINGAGYSRLYLKGLNVWANSSKTFGYRGLNSDKSKTFNNDYVFDLSKISENSTENHPYWVKLYDVYSHVFSAYETRCKAYLGFFIDKNSKKLKVICQTSNYLWSAGAVGRGLKVNFKLDAFYFIPNHI